jgi:hypothetical protein
MKSLVKKLIIAFAATLVLCNPANSQTDKQKSQSIKMPLTDSIFFNSLVAQYAKSCSNQRTGNSNLEKSKLRMASGSYTLLRDARYRPGPGFLIFLTNILYYLL